MARNSRRIAILLLLFVLNQTIVGKKIARNCCKMAKRKSFFSRQSLSYRSKAELIQVIKFNYVINKKFVTA